MGIVGKAGSSHALFSTDMLNPQHATFLNVTYGSSFDADDTHVGAMLHPGVAAWSAALAIAEHVGASGPEVLAAVVAGYETIIRIGLAIQPSHFKRGFQSTGTCDVFGTAAAAGRLLFRGGDAERRIAEAIGLAGSYPSGVAQFYYSGSSGKRIQAAHSAQCGVAAALLTQQGFGGPADIIEGTGGFARAYADGWAPEVIESGLGERFHLMDVLVKSHAAAARVAAGIDGMLALRQQHDFAHDDIASMHLGIPRIIQGRLTNPHPVDLQAAQMCLPFSVALAAKIPLPAGLIPMLAVADYEAGLVDRDLYELQERTTIALDDEVEAASNELSTAAKVSVRLHDGRGLAILVPAPEGQRLASVHRRRARGTLRSRAIEPRPGRGLRRHPRDREGPRSPRSAPPRCCAERAAPEPVGVIRWSAIRNLLDQISAHSRASGNIASPQIPSRDHCSLDATLR